MKILNTNNSKKEYCQVKVSRSRFDIIH